MVRIFCFIILLMLPLAASAEERSVWEGGDWLTKNLRVLISTTVQDPAASTQNPDNAFLRLYRHSGELAVRPDFFVDTHSVSGMFKPRFTASRRWWEDGAPAGETETHARAFVNEWQIQPKPHDRLVLSFGKEKLLWGPSFLVSPSNLLFTDIEKVNPKSEVEGKYLARAVWLPIPAITLSGISETERREDLLGGPVKPLRALKVDIMGGSALVSVIGFVRQDERFRLGSFGQWTALDAVLLYYDGIVTRGADALYPVLDTAHPLGWYFERLREDSNRLYATAVGGGSYTFLSGETISVEFLYHSAGYGDAEAQAYYLLRRNAADHVFDSGALADLSHKTLAEALAAGSPFLRQYYLMAQINSGEIKNELTVLLRYTRGLEERAGQASSIVEWSLTDRIQLFNINTIALPEGRDTEFNAIVGKSFLLGLEAHW